MRRDIVGHTSVFNIMGVKERWIEGYGGRDLNGGAMEDKVGRFWEEREKDRRSQARKKNPRVKTELDTHIHL